MKTQYKDAAIKKITEMPAEKVLKILIFMAGMDAEEGIENRKKIDQSNKPSESGRA